jgi:hypothetical protein
MNDFLFRMFALDTNGYTLVILICGWGFLIMRSMVPAPMLAVFSFPIMILSALVSNALLFDSPFVLSLERGPALAFTTGVGMIVALALIIGLVQLVIVIKDLTGRRPELLDRKP